MAYYQILDSSQADMRHHNSACGLPGQAHVMEYGCIDQRNTSNGVDIGPTLPKGRKSPGWACGCRCAGLHRGAAAFRFGEERPGPTFDEVREGHPAEGLVHGIAGVATEDRIHEAPDPAR